MKIDETAQTFTVEEAASILRIGRTTAYSLAREWRMTNGRSGLPVLELGRSLRVPRAALVRLLDQAGSQSAGSPRDIDSRSPRVSDPFTEPAAAGTVPRAVA